MGSTVGRGLLLEAGAIGIGLGVYEHWGRSDKRCLDQNRNSLLLLPNSHIPANHSHSLRALYCVTPWKGPHYEVHGELVVSEFRHVLVDVGYGFQACGRLPPTGLSDSNTAAFLKIGIT
jgi:hypothetical protein